jgi:DNA-binding CsgD family transcriptional regulator
MIEALCFLPAVATRDWCDLAAGAIAGVSHDAGAALLVATIGAQGAIVDMEAVGVANVWSPRRNGDERALRSSSESASHTIRTAASSLKNIGWEPRSPFSAAGEGRVLSGPVWPSGGTRDLSAALGTDRVVAGIVPIGEPQDRRCAVVFVAPGNRGPGAAEEYLGILQPCLPLLSRRALMALGHKRIGRSDWLSERERLVLDRLAAGLSVREIAEELGRSPHTVHDNVKSLHRKLSATTRGQLIARALGRISA